MHLGGCHTASTQGAAKNPVRFVLYVRAVCGVTECGLQFYRCGNRWSSHLLVSRWVGCQARHNSFN